jgi:hypothetical protein
MARSRGLGDVYKRQEEHKFSKFNLSIFKGIKNDCP